MRSGTKLSQFLRVFLPTLDLEKLRDPDVACTFQATISVKFAPLIGMRDEDMEMNIMTTTYNTVVTDAASEILVGTSTETAVGH